MDQRLLAWGLRPCVLARGGLAPCVPAPDVPGKGFSGSSLGGAKRRRPPRLWLFTDEQRVADPRASVAGLPVGRAGVVLRHDNDPARADLARDVALICRARRLMLSVAGDVRLARAVNAGIHLRGGRWPGLAGTRGIITSSAHSVAELRRAWRAGADLVFLSPAFATASHAGARGLGPLRWAAMARRGGKRGGAGPVIAALGGVDGASIKRLPPRLVQAAGAIGALHIG